MARGPRPAPAGPAWGGRPWPNRLLPAAMFSAGRWSLVHRSAVLGPDLAPEERAARRARLLLERYGIVKRDCLAHEDGAFSWPQLYQALQRLEIHRGEVQHGCFVAGLAGAQFTLPRAVESLRRASTGSRGKAARPELP